MEQTVLLENTLENEETILNMSKQNMIKNDIPRLPIKRQLSNQPIKDSPLKKQQNAHDLEREYNQHNLRPNMVRTSTLSKSFPATSIAEFETNSHSSSSLSLDDLDSQLSTLVQHSREQVNQVTLAHNTAIKNIATHHQQQLSERDKEIHELTRKLKDAEDKLQHLNSKINKITQQSEEKNIETNSALTNMQAALQRSESVIMQANEERQKVDEENEVLRRNLFVSLCLLLKLQSGSEGLLFYEYTLLSLFSCIKHYSKYSRTV